MQDESQSLSAGLGGSGQYEKQASYDDSDDVPFGKKKVHKRYWTSEEVSSFPVLSLDIFRRHNVCIFDSLACSLKFKWKRMQGHISDKLLR